MDQRAIKLTGMHVNERNLQVTNILTPPPHCCCLHLNVRISGKDKSSQIHETTSVDSDACLQA
uniref:Uncharacterized protein n=1 Tax=Anguilla anguilla TaxID=7936 RepID=A0A0E9QBZ5_ANGAN